MRLGKHSTSIALTALALFLSSLSLLVLYIFWHPSELWGTVGRLLPGESPSTIPRKLWYKLGPKGLSDDARAWTDSCIGNNTAYKVEFMTEDSADAYVQKTFGAEHPDLVDVYLGLTGSVPCPLPRIELASRTRNC